MKTLGIPTQPDKFMSGLRGADGSRGEDLTSGQGRTSVPTSSQRLSEQHPRFRGLLETKSTLSGERLAEHSSQSGHSYASGGCLLPPRRRGSLVRLCRGRRSPPCWLTAGPSSHCIDASSSSSASGPLILRAFTWFPASVLTTGILHAFLLLF